LKAILGSGLYYWVSVGSVTSRHLLRRTLFKTFF
jgi:hypothetical protein